MATFPPPAPARPLAVVTGASRGLGLALARVFAEHGFDLVLADEGPGLREVTPALEAFGGEVRAVQVELSTPAGVDALYAELVAQGRDIDVVAMSAGAAVSGEFLDTSLDDEVRLMQLNVLSLVRLTKKILPDLVKRGSGRLLYASPLLTELQGPFHAIEAASRSFVRYFAESLRAEVEGSGVTIIALEPGAGEPAQVARVGFEALMAGDGQALAGTGATVLDSALTTVGPQRGGETGGPDRARVSVASRARRHRS